MGKLLWIIWVGSKCNHKDLVKGKESVRAEGRMTDQRRSDALSSFEEEATSQGILVPTRNW